MGYVSYGFKVLLKNAFFKQHIKCFNCQRGRTALFVSVIIWSYAEIFGVGRIFGNKSCDGPDIRFNFRILPDNEFSIRPIPDNYTGLRSAQRFGRGKISRKTLEIRCSPIRYKLF